MDVISREQAIRLLADHRVKALPPAERESMLLDWWGLDERSEGYNELPASLRSRMKRSDAPDHPLDPALNPLLSMGVSATYRGSRNDYLSRKVSELLHQETEVVGEPEKLLPCPCCGYRTLPGKGDYDICPVCFWEDDGTKDPAAYSAPNHMTLAEGQKNFERYGACSPDMKAHVDPEGAEKYPHQS